MYFKSEKTLLRLWLNAHYDPVFRKKKGLAFCATQVLTANLVGIKI